MIATYPTIAALTLAIVVTWVALALGLSAIGVLFLNSVVARAIETEWRYAFLGIWTGFGLTIAGLMLWHFVLPVNEIAFIAFVAVAGVAVIKERSWFAALFRLRPSLSFVAFAAAFTIWAANHALGSGGYDDYTYELQTLRWFYQYPIVPGLANLHARLGFNNSHHLFAAMLSIGPWRSSVNHLVNGFFVALTCLFILDAIWRLARGTEKPVENILFRALLLFPCAGLLLFGPWGSMLGSLKADPLVCVAKIVLATSFLCWAGTPPGTAARGVLASTILVLGGVIPTIKLNGLVFCVVIVAAVLTCSARQILRNAAQRRAALPATAVGLVLFLGMIFRGVILSGYPFFPSTALAFNIDWRVPTAEAELERATVTAFARLPVTSEAATDFTRFGQRLNAARSAMAEFGRPPNPHSLFAQRWVWQWVKGTALTDGENLLLPLILGLALVPSLFVRRARDSCNSAERHGQQSVSPARVPEWTYAALSFASAASLVVWFTQAPAARFAMSDVWVLSASILVFVRQKQNDQRSYRALLIGLGSTLAAAAAVLFGYLHIHGNPEQQLGVLLLFAGSWLVLFLRFARGRPRLLAALCLLPSLLQYSEYLASGSYADRKSMLAIGFSMPSPPPVVQRRTCSGLTVYEVPYSRFDTPLPNTPYFNPLLQLRTSRVSDGFVQRDCKIAN